ncbi:unnamed protein product [Paramecium pentaurelia]|uniref:Uncharacterized protein n=1 Tax=Paramecium pentaurelia TaxID=43138 RepID=A0A8S1Y9K4_9CILI|nr:unnamed protein product [Paramecium pentaurelia]
MSIYIKTKKQKIKYIYQISKIHYIIYYSRPLRINNRPSNKQQSTIIIKYNHRNYRSDYKIKQQII